MFLHARRSFSRQTIPSWLKLEPIYVKKHVSNKLDPMVNEAELLEVNSNYVLVRMQDGRETTVSITDISSHNNTRAEGSENDAINKVGDQTMPLPSNNDCDADDLSLINVDESETTRSDNGTEQTMPLRRSTQVRKPVDKPVASAK